jgi:truncated hemoglobin YjbI
LIISNTVGAAALVAIAGTLGFIAYRLHRASSAALGTATPDAAPDVSADPQSATQLRAVPAADLDPVIAGPPKVRGDNVRDWLTHHTRGRYTWKDAVAQFYDRAAADREIASYFAHTDLAELQRHFTRAIVIVTSTGLTAKTVVRMAEIHRGIRDEHGRPITGEVYDKVITALVSVLTDMGVQGRAINDLAEVVAPLRRAIVAEVA